MRAPHLLSLTALSLIAGSVISLGMNESLREDISASLAYTDINNHTSAVATKLAGAPVRVDCNNAVLNARDAKHPLAEKGVTYETAGLVRFSSRHIPFYPRVMTLREDVCEALISPIDTPPLVAISSSSYEIELGKAETYANDVAILLHEIEHTDGILNEATAECYAYQKLPGALASLGLQGWYAEVVATETVHDISPTRPVEYTSPECRPGGSLDLAVSDIYIG